jgi:hypothetical protein
VFKESSLGLKLNTKPDCAALRVGFATFQTAELKQFLKEKKELLKN